MATLNVGMKVNRAITGATTVAANGYAMVTYNLSSLPGTNTGSTSQSWDASVITRYFGPGQSIPASFTTPFWGSNGSGIVTNWGNATYSLMSGVEIINTI